MNLIQYFSFEQCNLFQKWRQLNTCSEITMLFMILYWKNETNYWKTGTVRVSDTAETSCVHCFGGEATGSNMRHIVIRVMSGSKIFFHTTS